MLTIGRQYGLSCARKRIVHTICSCLLALSASLFFAPASEAQDCGTLASYRAASSVGTGALWYHVTLGQTPSYCATPNPTYTVTYDSFELVMPSGYTQSVGGYLATSWGKYTQPRTDTITLNFSCQTVEFSAVVGGTSTSAKVASYTCDSGVVYPKFVVLGVLYAPPGASSYVDYGASKLQGTSTSFANTFSKQRSYTVSTGFALGQIFNIGNSSTTSYTQQQDTSASMSISKSAAFNIKTRGPLSSSMGLNHDFDLIKIWLNASTRWQAASPAGDFVWSGYSIDTRDQAVMDVVDVYVGCLKQFLNQGTAPAELSCSTQLPYLARSWAGPNQGLTTSDYQTLLARDPFAYGQTVPDAKRYFLVGSVQYQAPPTGGQPQSSTWTQNYQVTNSEGRTATDIYDTSYTVEGGSSFLAPFTASVKDTTRLTWTNKWNETQTDTTGQSATFSITGPATTDNYSGPTEFQVYQDNVYGTFMFAPKSN